jgi:uncharacterized protein YhjY with autotransporter beta-barrel domain
MTDGAERGGFARNRKLLLGSAATLSLLAAPALAQSSVEQPTNTYLEAQGGGANIVKADSVLAPQVVIAAPGTPTTARDPNVVTGVGQMIVDEKNGFIGLCTGTLINPRTVIFAAHCVNERAANAYGSNSGGQPIAFGFNNNNNISGNSAFGFWLNGQAGGAKYLTNTGRYLYNVNQVTYNPGSLEPGASSFLYSDVALASLDTPAKDVPTWALLFSALPATPITANGTGYHVVIDGYGNNGTGITGSTGGIDYRRRIAENTLGALASLNDFEGFIFGAVDNLPQNLYWIDFDDPRRGTAAASPYDFNAWRDNALPNEGITASGDSGGPLILDAAYAKQLVIGVLSGGYTRFFNGQPANGYGTASFYQPLYLYWDWIAANNPYHYVSAIAGNGNWNDPTHWVTNVDPNYQIIGPNGQIVTGVPTTPGAGNTTQPGFGQACFQSGGSSDCFDIATRTETYDPTGHPIGTGAVAGGDNGAAMVSVATLDGSSGGADSTAAATSGVGVELYSREAQDGQSSNGQAVAALPAATLLNGLPGATNFVPGNTDGNRLTNTAARYFDVTLSATGTTTLDTAVTIDRFGIAGAGAMLDVTSTGSLTSLLGFNQITGTMQVNGSLITGGDYFMMTGGLNGTGTIRAAYFTSVAGTIAPGTASSIGTLTFQGNVILSSGNMLLLNLGSGASDKIVVQANGAGTGIANLGGLVNVSAISGYTIKAGDTYTILTAQGGVTGGFSGANAFSAILSPTFVYSTNAVQLVVTPGKYADVVSATSPVQKAYAQLLDQDRGGGAPGLPAIYFGLDLQNAATIQAQLEGWAPRNQTLSDALDTTIVDNMSRFYRDRLAGLHPGSLGGKLAMIGQPFQMASLAINGLQGQAEVRTDAGGEVHSQASLPETMSGYLAGGYINGHSRPMSTAIPAGGRDQFDGFYIAGGIEKEVSPYAAIGFSLSYSKLDGTTVNAPQSARAELIQGSVYAKVETPGGVTLDAIMSGGSLKANTVRVVSVLGTPYTLTGSNTVPAISGEIGLGKNFDAGKLTVTPRISARGSHIDLSSFTETGGGPALRYGRTSLDSLQGRAGLTLSGGTSIKPQLSGYFVHEFTKQALSVGANFVGGNGPDAIFALGGRDRDWAEISGGLTITTGKVDLSVSADTTISRDDVSNQSYRGSIAFHF